jgi:hypothetical protein
MPINNANELNSESRAHVEALIAQLITEQKRVGVASPMSCFYCGSGNNPSRCSCGIKSFGCAAPYVNTCPDCAAAHRKVARHFAKMFSFPKSNRVDSRRHAYFKQTVEAAEKIDANLFRELTKTEAWGDPDAVFKQRVLASFRKTNFTKFSSLARGIAEQEDAYLLRSIGRFIRSAG